MVEREKENKKQGANEMTQKNLFENKTDTATLTANFHHFKAILMPTALKASTAPLDDDDKEMLERFLETVREMASDLGRSDEEAEWLVQTLREEGSRDKLALATLARRIGEMAEGCRK